MYLKNYIIKVYLLFKLKNYTLINNKNSYRQRTSFKQAKITYDLEILRIESDPMRLRLILGLFGASKERLVNIRDVRIVLNALGLFTVRFCGIDWSFH